MPPGYFLRRTDAAIVTVLLYVIMGYALSMIAYSAPFLFYDFRLIFPGLYFMFFLNRPIILMMLFVLGGLIGVVLGQMLRESVETEETTQRFAKPRP